MSSQQKKIFILSGIAVIAFLAWFFFLLHPLQNALHEKDDLIVQEQIRSEIARKQEENVQATVREYEQLRSSSETFTSFFVSEKNILTFIASLEKIALESSVTQEIENLVAPTSGSTTTSFQLVVHGTTQNLLDYLAGLEQDNYYIVIQQMSFTSTNPPSASSPVNLSLSVTIHWL